MATSNTKRNVGKSGLDLYNTPTDALEAAYEAGIFDKFQRYWDPCNGLGKISDFLKDKGKKVITSDVNDYGKQDWVEDFLTATDFDVITSRIECIVMNPPFKLTEEFIDHALTLCPNLIMFNRAVVLESVSRSRKHQEGSWPLKEFYSFANRVTCTKGVEEEKTSNAVWYAWYVYEDGYKGKPTVDWLFTK